MDASVFAPLGVYAVTVTILLYVLKELWADNREIRSQMRSDQQEMLPALSASTEALKSALEESVRNRALAERERR